MMPLRGTRKIPALRASEHTFLRRSPACAFWVAVLSLGCCSLPTLRADDPKPAPPKAAGLPIAELKRETHVDFETEVLPFLKNNCLACHNTTKAKGGLNLETPQLMRKGGDSGPAVTPGKSQESLMLKAASHIDPELIMPPKDNKANASDLKPEQLALLRLWIDQGAQGDVHAARPVDWLAQPPKLDPILAVALTRDGQFAACGRGNRIDVYHVPSGQCIAQLADPKLAGAPGMTNAAHRDLVNSLAFNPEGTLLASSGFREVKLWKRPRLVPSPFAIPAEAARLFAVSPDQRQFAAVLPDHVIALYELPGGKLTQSLTGHSNTITAIAFSPDRQFLASVSDDKTLRIWSVSTGKTVTTVETPAELKAVTWLGDSNRLAAAGTDGLVRTWTLDGSTAAPGRELKGHEGAVSALAALPGGKELLSGGADGIIRQWNVEEGKKVRELKEKNAIVALAMRPDGKRFASCGTDKVALLWDAESGKVVGKLKGDRYANELAAETERTLAVAKVTTEFQKKTLETAEAEAKKQTDRVATATATNTFTEKVFLEKEKALKESQEAKGKAEKELEELLAFIKKTTEDYEKADQAAKEASTLAKSASERAAQAQLAAERAALSKTDAEKIATETSALALRTKATLDNVGLAKDTARRIAEESAAVAEKSRGFSEAVAADADMKTKLAGEAKSGAEKAIEQVATLAFAAGQLKPAYDKTVSEAPERRKQATNKIESATKTLDGAQKEFQRAETRKSVTGHELELALQGASRASNSVSQAKSTLETAETRQRKTAETLEAEQARAARLETNFLALAFSPDGRTLATLDPSGRAQTWSADHATPIEVFPAPAAAPMGGDTNAATRAEPGSIAFLDGQTLVAPNGPKLAAWELQPRWALERTIGTGDIDSPLSDRVNAVRFSPDGQTLATGGGEPTRSGEIKLWRVSDGVFQREFTNVHSDAVFALDFSPDGRHLASAAADRFVRVVELATGKVVRAFEGHTSYVLGVAWKSDSRTLASAGADNVIKIWDFTTGDRKKNIEGASKEVTSIAFMGITDQALATSGDNQVRVLKENGDKVRSFEGPADFMNAAATTPDGKLVVAGGQDGILRLWHGEDGKAITNFEVNP
jgi:WD40 repeat protein